EPGAGAAADVAAGGCERAAARAGNDGRGARRRADLRATGELAVWRLRGAGGAAGGGGAVWAHPARGGGGRAGDRRTLGAGGEPRGDRGEDLPARGLDDGRGRGDRAHGNPGGRAPHQLGGGGAGGKERRADRAAGGGVGRRRDGRGRAAGAAGGERGPDGGATGGIGCSVLLVAPGVGGAEGVGLAVHGFPTGGEDNGVAVLGVGLQQRLASLERAAGEGDGAEHLRLGLARHHR